MNKEEAFKEIKLLTVKIETEYEKGTGVLIFKNNRAYVLTVHHCIYGKKEPYHNLVENSIKITLDSKISKILINPIECTVYKNDIVCLELDTKIINNIKIELNIQDKMFHDEEYFLRGYPKAFSDAHRFNATYNDEIDKNKFRITVDYLTNDTSGDDAVDYIKGLSGSGVFSYKENKLYLTGLVNNLANKAGTFNAIDCVKLLLFNNEVIKEEETVFVNSKSNSYSFYIFRRLVTFEEFDEFCNQCNREKPENHSYKSERGKYPVVNINLNDANKYCEWLSDNNKTYRLPTSSEWDYIAKKNKISKKNLDDYIWHKGNTKKRKAVATTKKVGKLGIYDLHGNVDEWCSDLVIKESSMNRSVESIIKTKNMKPPHANIKNNLLGFRVIFESI
ncbi:MAG: SUMF1/EgtB/PvdO family nonheme iron enzyme [Cocleimonas sp.]|nr:SUMF1/EgtB/PvdO family nonheme iron enzyme [Cocleimonas sp.]